MGIDATRYEVAVIDASALVAAFTDEPGRVEVERILNTPDARMSAANVVEVYDKLMRLHDESRESVDGRFETLRRIRSLVVVPLDERVAARAGELRSVHYHRASRPVSHADCAALATAEVMHDVLVTTDRDLVEIALQEGVEVIRLPDSSGKRP